MLNQRLERFASQLDLDPAKFIFIDETGASTNLARKGGRCRRRLRVPVPHGHYKTVTLVAGLRCDRLTAPHVCDMAAQRRLVRGMGGKNAWFPLSRKATSPSWTDIFKPAECENYFAACGYDTG